MFPSNNLDKSILSELINPISIETDKDLLETKNKVIKKLVEMIKNVKQ